VPAANEQILLLMADALQQLFEHLAIVIFCVGYVPRSEHLFKTLQPELEDLLLLGRSYEALFDEFEILVALTYRDLEGGDWGPLGRFGWKQRRSHGDSPFDRVVKDAEREGESWGPLRAGLFGGSYVQFSTGAQKFRALFKHVPFF
jgi:hypothetical protein